MALYTVTRLSLINLFQISFLFARESTTALLGILKHVFLNLIYRYRPVCFLHVANVGYITEAGNTFKYLEDGSLELLRDATSPYAAAGTHLFLL